MTPEQYQRLKHAYEDVVQASEEERAELVERVCGTDQTMKQELAALLNFSDTRTDNFNSSILNSAILRHHNKLRDGDLILNRFRIVRHVGSGGMGDVYEAMDLELGKTALKTIRDDIADRPDILVRFKKEVQIARKISSPYVCRTYDLFLCEAGTGTAHALLTMEFLDGITAAERLHQCALLAWDEVLPISLQICSGLQAIHDAGIIHRDLKTRNIMLSSRAGTPCAVLMDFGIAREVSSAIGCDPMSVYSSQLIGTPNYMAPEQFARSQISQASDIYALGIVLYELFSGKHPFEGETDAVRAAALRAKKPPPISAIRGGLPRRIDHVVSKCLELNPQCRFQSAQQVAEAIQGRNIVYGLPRNRWWYATLIGTVLLALLGILETAFTPIRHRLQGIFFSSPQKHIAILPFSVSDHAEATTALAAGLNEAIAGELANLGDTNKSLWIVPPTEVRKRKVEDATGALREFGATIAITGAFEERDNIVHLKLSVIDTKKLREIGYTELDDDRGDLKSIETAAVRDLGRLMNLVSSPTAGSTISPAVTTTVYEQYLTALGYMQRFDKVGNLDRAEVILARISASDPRFALALARTGQLYFLKYRLESRPEYLHKSAQYCERAYGVDPTIPLVYVILGRVHDLEGHPDLAILEFKHALQLDPNNSDAIAGLAHSYENTRQTALAEATYTKTIEMRPEDWSGYNNLGNFYQRLGRYRDAIEQYRSGIRLTPDNAALYANLGSAMLNSDDQTLLPAAEGALKRSIEIGPTYQAWANLGALYSFTHRFRDAAASTENALRINDEDYLTWDNLAQACTWLGDETRAHAARNKAIELAERAVLLNSQDADAQATLAALLALEHRKLESLVKIRTALALAPQSQSVLAEAADAYEALGDKRKAVKCLQLALHNGYPRNGLSADPELDQIARDPAFAGSQHPIKGVE